jgi:anhydro-N-acetylmuramic acid kinase
MIRQNLIAIGIMCGTSKDGIDMMIGKTDGIAPLKSIATISISLSAVFQRALRAAEYGLKETLGDIERVDQNFNEYLYKYAKSTGYLSTIEELTEELKSYLEIHELSIKSLTSKYTSLCTDLIKQLLTKAGLENKQIDIIGDHGITLYHNPSKKITIQIADGQKLANETGIFVVNDFRYCDVQNGGQGAPLAPIYHQALMESQEVLKESWTVVNLGGTANITFKKNNKLIGFDTGPANVLLDDYVRTYSKAGLTYDIDGRAALAGKVQQELFEILKELAIEHIGQNYLEIMPPKSLDISNYKLPEQIKNYSFEDSCATLAAFTAYCVIVGLKLLDAKVDNIVVCGGGAKNPAILEYLRQYAQAKMDKNVKILKADEVSINSDYAEAELMAFLSVKTLHKEPITFATATGCAHDTLGGHGYLPNTVKVNNRLAKLIKENADLLNGYRKNLS